jgi:hypothetical protein
VFNAVRDQETLDVSARELIGLAVVVERDDGYGHSRAEGLGHADGTLVEDGLRPTNPAGRMRWRGPSGPNADRTPCSSVVRKLGGTQNLERRVEVDDHRNSSRRSAGMPGPE